MSFKRGSINDNSTSHHYINPQLLDPNRGLSNFDAGLIVGPHNWIKVKADGSSSENYRNDDDAITPSSIALPPTDEEEEAAEEADEKQRKYGHGGRCTEESDYDGLDISTKGDDDIMDTAELEELKRGIKPTKPSIVGLPPMSSSTETAGQQRKLLSPPCEKKKYVCTKKEADLENHRENRVADRIKKYPCSERKLESKLKDKPRDNHDNKCTVVNDRKPPPKSKLESFKNTRKRTTTALTLIGRRTTVTPDVAGVVNLVDDETCSLCRENSTNADVSSFVKCKIPGHNHHPQKVLNKRSSTDIIPKSDSKIQSTNDGGKVINPSDNKKRANSKIRQQSRRRQSSGRTYDVSGVEDSPVVVVRKQKPDSGQVLKRHESGTTAVVKVRSADDVSHKNSEQPADNEQTTSLRNNRQIDHPVGKQIRGSGAIVTDDRQQCQHYLDSSVSYCEFDSVGWDY